MESSTKAFSDKLALLVVDMQDRVLKVLPEREKLLKRVAFAIEAASLLGVNIVFTEQLPEKLGPVNAGLLKLAPKHEVFDKTAFSALQAGGLVKHLSKKKTEHLLVCGIETPICVYQTILQAMRKEFDVTLLSDCHGGRRNEDKEAVMRFLEINGAHVLPSETVFYSLLADAKHPQFKEFTQLVKSYAKT